MHDYDNNSKLDGLEILHGLFHHHDHSHEEGTILGPTAPHTQRDGWGGGGSGGVAVANIQRGVGGPFNSQVTALVWKVLLIYTWQQISGRTAI